MPITQTLAWENRLSTLLVGYPHIEQFVEHYRAKDYLSGYKELARYITEQYPELKIWHVLRTGIWVGLPIDTPFGTVYCPCALRMTSRRKIWVKAMVNMTRVERPIFASMLFKQYFSQPAEALYFLDRHHVIPRIYNVLHSKNFVEGVYALDDNI